ncbi:MAG: MBL fold metallo-hydrolase [Proteobacteria bacterium]|nr:MBL fold metallo-hydrolase [Pseudomonadota bacterium]
MRITILGCGGAGGVPMIGGRWGACDPENPRNRRRRASILVEEGGTAVLVDTSPDLRQQLLDADVSRLDGVIYTHDHADHVHGIDELRALNRLQRQWIDLYADTGTLNGLRKRFSYVFEPERKVPEEFAFYKPCLTPHEIAPAGVFTVGALEIEPFDQDHGFMRTLGLRFADAAYTTDAVDLPDSAFAALTGVRLWIIGCLRYAPHPTHAHLDKVLDWIRRVRPQRAVLTHLGSDMDFDALAARLPEGVTPAYDGLVLEV